MHSNGLHWLILLWLNLSLFSLWMDGLLGLKILGACLVHFFWSLNFHHSSLNFHHSSLITLNTKVVWYHHSISITHYFSHYLEAPHLSWCSFFFSFSFFFPIPRNPNPVEKKKTPSEEEREKNKIKKNPVKTEPVKEEEEGKKKPNERPNQWERRRKKKSVGQNMRLSGSLMCI